MNFLTYYIILLALNRSAVAEMLTTQPPWYKLNNVQVIFKIDSKLQPEYGLDSSLGPEVRNFLAVIFNYDRKR